MTANNLNYQSIFKIWSNSADLFYLKMWSGNKILTIKGHNSVTNVWEIMLNNPKLDPVNMNAYIKFG